MRVVVCGVKDHDGLLTLARAARIDGILKRVKDIRQEEGRRTIYINPSSSPDVVINPSNCTTSPAQITYTTKPTFTRLTTTNQSTCSSPPSPSPSSPASSLPRTFPSSPTARYETPHLFQYPLRFVYLKTDRQTERQTTLGVSKFESCG